MADGGLCGLVFYFVRRQLIHISSSFSSSSSKSLKKPRTRTKRKRPNFCQFWLSNNGVTCSATGWTAEGKNIQRPTFSLHCLSMAGNKLIHPHHFWRFFASLDFDYSLVDQSHSRLVMARFVFTANFSQLRQHFFGMNAIALEKF